MLRQALATHEIAGALNSLLPTHPQYAALKAALAATGSEPTQPRRDRIRLNMDRWRWLPRDLGEKYVIVNVPGFHATLVENGVNRWKQRAIAGATKTPTPQLSAMAVGVMLNPSWEVPPSITHEVSGKKGFVPVMKDGKLIRWSQPPGPTNALGQVKFVMYNPHNIYLHDTNARSRFSSRMRALSHGCIRTEHIVDLATELLGDDGGDVDARQDPGAARYRQDQAGEFREAAAGLHRLFQLGRAERRPDRRLSGPLWPRRQGDGGAQHEGWRSCGVQGEAEGGGSGGRQFERRLHADPPVRFMT